MSGRPPAARSSPAARARAISAAWAAFTPNKGTGSYKFRARFRKTTGTGASAYTTNATIKVS